MTDPGIAIVIPANDEAANLPGLIADVRRIAEDVDAEVIIVGDSSFNTTAAVLRDLAAHCNRQGCGGHPNDQLPCHPSPASASESDRLCHGLQCAQDEGESVVVAISSRNLLVQSIGSDGIRKFAPS
jgi:hypothetical protein